jgi:pimeloyl-ACP methyl ester carboxylesterase
VSTDLWTAFQLGSTAERLAMIRDPASRAKLSGHLGAAAVQDYLELAARVLSDDAHLGDQRVPNLVFVPGTMGSVLTSSGLGGVWWIDVRSLHKLDRLGLAADGEEDADAGAQISAVAVDGSYDTFCTAVLTQPDFGHVNFQYDWRKPIPSVAGGLGDLVRATYAGNGNRPVHLVAHSMGGLVIREALRADPTLWGQVGRVAFLGTPHYGSPAIAGYLKNHLWGFEFLVLLARYLSRPTLRSMWGVLDLLPAPAGVYPDSTPGEPDGHPCANFDLYDAGAYRLGLSPDEQARLQRVLDAARQFHVDLAESHRNLSQEQRDRMLMVAGVGFKTLFRTAYKPAFGFLWEHMDRVTSRKPGDPHRDGDGRVPQASAQLPFLGATRYVRGEHGGLPKISAVQEAVFAWLRGNEPGLSKTPQAALAAHLGDDAQPEPTDGLAADDPGYLQVDPPVAVMADRQQDVEEGRLPEFAQVKIL